MKIMQINCVYKKGSTGRIMFDIHTALIEQGIESVVCYGRGKTVREKGVIRVSNEIYSKFNNLWSRITGLAYGGCFFSTIQTERAIKREKPDVVHLQCINGFFVNVYSLIEWLKKHKINTVLTMHAELMYTANCGSSLGCKKWQTGCGNCPCLRQSVNSYLFDRTAESVKRMTKAFSDNETHLKIAAVSEWLADEAKKSVVLKNHEIRVIHNGIDTDSFYYRPEEGEKLRKKYARNGEKIILQVSSDFYSAVKGGKYFIELANRMKNENVVFLLVGLEKKDESLPENIINIGTVSSKDELAAFYSAADLFVLTSFQETFSNVCAECTCCGTPVIGFKAGGPERVFTFEDCCFAEQGDINALETAVKKFLSEDRKQSKEILSDLARNRFSKKKMTNEYIKVYNEFYQNKE